MVDYNSTTEALSSQPILAKVLINTIIDDSNLPFSDFRQFEEDNLPSNSDVMVILNQYLTCLKNFTQENIISNPLGDYYWVIQNKTSKIEADINSIF